MQDFVLEEKAKRFLFGDGGLENDDIQDDTQQYDWPHGKLSKQEIETLLMEFVVKNGRIRKIDFSREKNRLPSFSLIMKYWGGIKQMQKELGFPISVPEWDRESIKLTVENYIRRSGNIIQSDFKSGNGLPSIPCILAYFPELHNFSEIKEFFGLQRRYQNWTYESVVQAGKAFVNLTNGRLTQKDLKRKNNLPGMKVIQKFFGSLKQYQQVIGAHQTQRNELITVEELEKAVIEYFGNKERVVYNRREFFGKFVYSQSTVIKRFESVDNFFEKHEITESKPKKYRYTKKEIDRIILEFIKAGNGIPKTPKELTKIGLPSSYAIMRYYDSWREPFIYFQRLYEKVQ